MNEILVQKKTNKFGYRMFVVNVFITARRGDILKNKKPGRLNPTWAGGGPSRPAA